MVKIPEYEIEDDSYYLFTSAQLAVRESEFVDDLKFERMAAVNTIEGLKKIISETYYSDFLNLVSPENNLDNIILRFNSETARFLLERLKPGHKAVIDLLFCEESIHNYKIILKSLILKQNLSNLFIPLTYSYDVLFNELSKQNLNLIEINPETKLLLEKINLLKNEDLNFQDMEIRLERIYMEHLFDAIVKIKSRMLLEYLKHFIDILNIKNISRIRYSGIKLKFDDVLAENGFLPVSLFMKYENENIENLVQEIANTEYYIITEHGIRNLQSRNSFFSFDKNEFIFYKNFFNEIKYTVANLEKIFSFFIRKKIELKVLNMIYLGVLYGIAQSKLNHKVGIISEK